MSTKFGWFRLLAILFLALMLLGIFVGGRQHGAGSLFLDPWDKLVHLACYATLTVMTAIAFPKLPLPILVVIIVSIGASDEIAQIYIPGRSADIKDYAADVLGSLIALAPIYWLQNKFNYNTIGRSS